MREFAALPARVYTGPDCHRKAALDLKTDRHRRIVLISDAVTRQEGKLALFEQQLQAHQLRFDTVVIDPGMSLEQADAQGRAINQTRYDAYVSLGAKFVCGFAKIFWAMATNPQFDLRAIGADFGAAQQGASSKLDMHGRAQFVAIPTAYMLGSEFGPLAIGLNPDGSFAAAVDFALMADRLVLDPLLMVETPGAEIADNGFDAFTHALEVYLAHRTDVLTRTACVQAIRIYFEHLPTLVHKPSDQAARAHILDGMLLASIALSNGFSGIVHSMTVGLQRQPFGLGHGASHGTTIVHSLPFLAQRDMRVAQRCVELLRLLDLTPRDGAVDGAVAARVLVQHIETLKRQIGLPATIAAAGVARQVFDQGLQGLAETAANYQSTRYSPVQPSVAEFKHILQSAYGQG